VILCSYRPSSHLFAFRNAYLRESRVANHVPRFETVASAFLLMVASALHSARVGKYAVSQVTSLPICCFSVFIILSCEAALKLAAGASVKEGGKCSACASGKLEWTRLFFFLWFCTGVKLGL
jgi:hypothetical protein